MNIENNPNENEFIPAYSNGEEEYANQPESISDIEARSSFEEIQRGIEDLLLSLTQMRENATELSDYQNTLLERLTEMYKVIKNSDKGVQ